MTKSEQAKAEVIQLLLYAGFTADGETARMEFAPCMRG